ncbi:MAG: TIGR04282 family arsenosugar biosynthesis glycosyltransferase [Cyanobacteria bacterium J06641_5]
MERLIVFSRYPEPGKTKTRLIPAIGPVGAANLQRQLTEAVLRTVRQLQQLRPQLEVVVYYAGGDLAAMAAWLGEGNYQPQAAGDLGVRLRQAFADAWAAGCQRAMAIGIDCLEADAAVLARGLAGLQSCGVALGPATDGGYYTVGLRRDCSELATQIFDNIDWGSDRVLGQTLAIVRNFQQSLVLLPYRRDIDRPGDLWSLPQELRGAPELALRA